ncbi:hypothetical protein NIES2098_41170 [Calothrix sp. NIES-2098]|nr:hypothetical protein NIES2098_41170 [Calothrix sp. NIES-2098]
MNIHFTLNSGVIKLMVFYLLLTVKLKNAEIVEMKES